MKRTDRLLILFYRLMMGEHIKKHLFIEEYSISKRTFDRYIEFLRMTMSDMFSPHSLCYDALDNSYYITGLKRVRFRGIELLPLLYLLFGSRALDKDDIAEILYPLLALLPDLEKAELQMIAHQMGQVYETSEETVPILKLLWDLHCTIRDHQRLLLRCKRSCGIEKIPVLPIRLVYQNEKFLLLASLEKEEVAFFPLQQIVSFTVLTE